MSSSTRNSRMPLTSPLLRSTQLLAHLASPATTRSVATTTASKMATAQILAFNPAKHQGTFSTPPIDEATASKTTSLLQENHNKNHMYFNPSGFHNHLVHHMLALYAFNAPPEVLKEHYDDNSTYQKPMKPVDPKTLENLEHPDKFKQYLYKRDHYHDYMALFESEIDKLGVRGTLDKYLWAGDARANDMCNRMFAGILHPIIHLGYGIEWEQPAIIAEALGMIATHDAWPGWAFEPIEKLIAEHGPSKRTLHSLVEEASGNEELKNSVREHDDVRGRDGVVSRGGKLFVPLAAQWTVGEDELEVKLAEVANFTAGMVGAAQRRDKVPRLDFTLVHCANSIPLVAAMVRSDLVPSKYKAMLVQRSGVFALLTYVGQGSPKLDKSYVREYSLKEGPRDWDSLTQRAIKVQDDGHIIKLFRALRHGEKIHKQVGEQEGWLLAQSDWLKLGNVLIEVAERGPSDSGRFIFGAGFPNLWERMTRYED